MKKLSSADSFQKVVEAASLEEVSLVFSKCECRVPSYFISPDEIVIEFEKEIIPEILKQKQDDDGEIYSHIYFTAIGISKKSIKELKIKKGGTLFSISVSYAVIYDIDDIKTLDQKMLTVFGTKNAFYNAYPYIREFIHHMSTRLSIPPITLPLLKPGEDL